MNPELLYQLFSEPPRRPDSEIAERLVKRRTVSVLRGRCLQRLHRAMQLLGL